jgi:hypothetical protein
MSSFYRVAQGRNVNLGMDLRRSYFLALNRLLIAAAVLAGA